MRCRTSSDSGGEGIAGVYLVVQVWLIVGLLLLAPSIQAEVQDCVRHEGRITCTRVACRMREGTTTCPRTPVPPGHSTPSPMSTPTASHEQVFHGRVVAIVENDTLAVDSQGTITQVRIKTAWPWAPEDVSHEDLAAVSLHHDVTVSVHQADAQGVIVTTVLLANGTDLGAALWQYHMQKPDARAHAQQQAETLGSQIQQQLANNSSCSCGIHVDGAVSEKNSTRRMTSQNAGQESPSGCGSIVQGRVRWSAAARVPSGMAIIGNTSTAATARPTVVTSDQRCGDRGYRASRRQIS